MRKIILSKPIKKDGNKISELNLDFDKITGKEILAAEKETRLLGDSTPDAWYSKTFQAVLAAKAANEAVIVDDVMNMAGPDFMQVTTLVSNFLFGWALPDNLQQK